MPRGSLVARHIPPLSQHWEGIAQDERPLGETFNESSLRRAKPYVCTRGSPASMTLERSPRRVWPVEAMAFMGGT